MKPIIRPVEKRDNSDLKQLIPKVLEEFGAVGEGYACADPEVQSMYEAYQKLRSQYWIIELNGKVMGGGGVAPLKNGPREVCELQKMYFKSQIRGKGLANSLLEKALHFAVDQGFQKCYLETLPHMYAAQALYLKFGFKFIDSRMGNTGHSSCPTFMLKEFE